MTFLVHNIQFLVQNLKCSRGKSRISETGVIIYIINWNFTHYCLDEGRVPTKNGTVTAETPVDLLHCVGTHGYIDTDYVSSL